MRWWCRAVGHHDHWIQVGDHRVRACSRCGWISAVVTWRQWPLPAVDPEIGQTTSNDRTASW